MTPRSQPLHSTDQLAPRVLFHDNKEYTMPTLTGLFTIGHAEQRVTASGTPTLQLSLAYDYGRKGDDGRKPTQWVRAAIFGKQAEAMAPYLTKGKQIEASIRDLHVTEYTKRDGNHGAALEGVAEFLSFARGPRDDAQPAPRQPAPQQRATAAQSSGFDGMDDDITF